jgi:hypothetical protein
MECGVDIVRYIPSAKYFDNIGLMAIDIPKWDVTQETIKQVMDNDDTEYREKDYERIRAILKNN